MLTVFDYAVIAVIGLSGLRGMWRGLIAEVFGLIGWVVAFIVATRFVGVVLPYIPATWPGGTLTQWVVAFAILVIGVMLLVAVLSALLNRLTDMVGLRGVDRALGGLFGLIRGVVLVLILVVVAGLTEAPQHDFWRDSLLRPYAEQGIRAVKPMLPEALAAYVHF
jgi:membrane protein required for colicin V production